MVVRTIQLGKHGITDNFIASLLNQFKATQTVKVSVLKSAKREDIKEYSDDLLEKLGKKFTSKTIGFTIILKKWRQDKR